MRRKTFSLVVGLIFLLIAVMHALRLALKWEVVLNGWSVPMWVSVVAMVMAAYLAFEGLKLGRRGYPTFFLRKEEVEGEDQPR